MLPFPSQCALECFLEQNTTGKDFRCEYFPTTTKSRSRPSLPGLLPKGPDGTRGGRDRWCDSSRANLCRTHLSAEVCRNVEEKIGQRCLNAFPDWVRHRSDKR